MNQLVKGFISDLTLLLLPQRYIQFVARSRNNLLKIILSLRRQPFSKWMREMSHSWTQSWSLDTLADRSQIN